MYPITMLTGNIDSIPLLNLADGENFPILSSEDLLGLIDRITEIHAIKLETQRKPAIETFISGINEERFQTSIMNKIDVSRLEAALNGLGQNISLTTETVSKACRVMINVSQERSCPIISSREVTITSIFFPTNTAPTSVESSL